MTNVVKIILKVLFHLAWAAFGIWFLMDVMKTGITEFLQMPDASTVGFWEYVLTHGALKAIAAGFAIWGVVSLLLLPVSLFDKLHLLAAIPIIALIVGAVIFSFKYWPEAVEAPHWGWLFLTIPLVTVVYIYIILFFAALAIPSISVFLGGAIQKSGFVSIIVGTILSLIVLAILAIVGAIISYFAEMIIVGIILAIVVGIILSMPVTYVVAVYVKN